MTANPPASKQLDYSLSLQGHNSLKQLQGTENTDKKAEEKEGKKKKKKRNGR